MQQKNTMKRQFELFTTKTHIEFIKLLGFIPFLKKKTNIKWNEIVRREEIEETYYLFYFLPILTIR